MVVVAMHETPRRHSAQLREQLEWAAQHFALIGPGDLPSFWEASQAPTDSKPRLLFTFDDGRQSNYAVAAPLLEALGARGIFFVIPDFIGLRGHAAREFYYSRIDIRGLPPSDMEEDWTPMSAGQLRDLARRGHAIGSHTLTHMRLAQLEILELQRQVSASAEAIARWIEHPVDYFAWPYAWDAIDKPAWDLARRTYRFCFSPCPGSVDSGTDSAHLIWRNEIESYYPREEYRFMYSGLVDLVWAARRARLKRVLAAA